jgi:HD-GYP domain-containing protein (c-di-GMP phosphodiesterase class II)
MDEPTSLPAPSTRAARSDSGETLTADTSSLLVSRLIDVVRMRDPDLASHGQRAAHVAAAIAMEMGLDTATIDRTYLGAQLHDIGKLGVAEAVLWKPAGLSRGEWTQIRTHPEKGHRLVADMVHRDVAAAVLSHHERLDGSGYPHGIAARTLPITVRIVQVADAFDAMTSDRPYDRALASELAVAEILRCAGTQFDPEAAAALTNLLALGFEDDATIDISMPDPVLTVTSADPFAATA